jgi:predicted dehydrogenase
MALDVPTCERMIDAAEKNGVKFMVAQVNRFFPEFMQAKRMVESGAVGTPAIVRASRGGVKPAGWFLNHNLSGGVIFDLMIHDIDWLAWTFGPVETVYAQGLAGRDLGGLDYALLSLTFKSGLIALVEGNWAYSPKGFSVSLEVAGDGGLITFDSKSAMPISVKLIDPTLSAGTVVPQTTGERDPYWSELRHFVDCVQTGVSPSVSPHESLTAVRIASAALESAKRGEPMRVGGVN